MRITLLFWMHQRQDALVVALRIAKCVRQLTTILQEVQQYDSTITTFGRFKVQAHGCIIHTALL
jgi:hypothetical protein